MAFFNGVEIPGMGVTAVIWGSVDKVLSLDSSNPVENKVIAAELIELRASIDRILEILESGTTRYRLVSSDSRALKDKNKLNLTTKERVIL